MRPYWGLTTLEGVDTEFPPMSSQLSTQIACRRWRVAKCPLQEDYWKRTLQEEGFPPKFQTWLFRTISEGVDLGYRGGEKDHVLNRKKRTAEETRLLAAQYVREVDLGRVVCAGQVRPWGRLFKKFFVSSTYTIPKKRMIGQPQKWRLIHNLSSHTLGRHESINAGIDKEDFPVTYPSIGTATHVIFCSAPRGCVVWGRDLKEYYRHLMINPAYWWCTGTRLGDIFYFDCYCPFGARSMPAVFQRLSDAIRVVMLRRTPVDALLGMLDDFLGVVYREPGETDAELLQRGRQSETAFDRELVKMGIAKQGKKDSPTAWSITWLGFHLDTRYQTLGIPEDKQQELLQRFHAEFMNDGAWLGAVNTKILEKMLGTLCHFSQAWPLGKTLLWPLYMLMNPYRGFTAAGRPYILSATVKLNGECIASLDEWYMRVCTHGLLRQFKSCRGTNSVTQIGMWWDRRGRRSSKGGRKKGKEPRSIRLVTPWGGSKGYPSSLLSLAGRRPMAQVVAMSIKLLRKFLGDYVERCGNIVEIRTNVGEFATYIEELICWT